MYTKTKKTNWIYKLIEKKATEADLRALAEEALKNNKYSKMFETITDERLSIDYATDMAIRAMEQSGRNSWYRFWPYLNTLNNIQKLDIKKLIEFFKNKGWYAAQAGWEKQRSPSKKEIDQILKNEKDTSMYTTALIMIDDLNLKDAYDVNNIMKKNVQANGWNENLDFVTFKFKPQDFRTEIEKHLDDNISTPGRIDPDYVLKLENLGFTGIKEKYKNKLLSAYKAMLFDPTLKGYANYWLSVLKNMYPEEFQK